jgi:hypothetical protein
MAKLWLYLIIIKHILMNSSRYGLYTGIALSIYTLVITLTPLSLIRVAEFGIFAILIIGIVIGSLQYAKAKQYSLNFGEYFGVAFRIVASSILVLVLTKIILHFAFPQFKEQKLAALKQQGLALNKPLAEVNKVVAEQSEHYLSLEISRTVFPIMILGSITCIVVAFGLSKINTPKPLN